MDSRFACVDNDEKGIPINYHTLCCTSSNKTRPQGVKNFPSLALEFQDNYNHYKLY